MEIRELSTHRRMGAFTKKTFVIMATEYFKIVLATIFLLARSIYFALLRLIGRPLPWTFVALMYHTIKPDESARFSHQMERLRKHAHIVRAGFSVTSALPAKRYVALTFDDGYESFGKHVVPELRKNQIFSTVFVVTRYLGQNPCWVPNDGRCAITERLLSADELSALLKEGLVDIGSHSVNHLPLSLSDLTAEEVRSELMDSKRHLEDKLGQAITLFAPPYGTFDDTVLQIAREAGYLRMFLSLPLGNFANINGDVAGRVDASPNDSCFSFWLKVRGAYQFLPYVITIKARLLEFVRKLKEF